MIVLTNELEALTTKIQTFIQTLYVESADFVELFKIFSEEQVKIIENCGYKFDVKDDISTIANGMKKIQECLDNLPLVSVTLAFEPSVSLCLSVKDFVEENISKSAVLNIKIDKQIYGGLILEHDGKHQDHSIKSIVDSVFDTAVTDTQKT